MQDPNTPSNSKFGDETGGAGPATADRSQDRADGMQENAPEAIDEATGKMSEWKDEASEKASDLKAAAAGKASEYGSKLTETADTGIDKAAEGLEKAAVQLRSHSEDGGVQGQVGTRVADGLDKTSQYLRDHEAQEIWSDVEQFVKDHPLQAAAGAALAGYVVAKLMK